jgi:outer membrane protein OmpA-like peptidoglycan-associated protein
MRVVLTVLLIVVLVPAVVVDSMAGGCGRDCKCCSCKKKCDDEITEFIYDAVFPWPFRKKAADSDGDGVPDSMDKCPGTRAGVKVDEYGCAVSSAETKLLDTGMIRTSKIVFATDKAELKPESYPTLDEIGDVLVKWPGLKIEIGGHTDAVASPEYNQELSEKRAEAVLDYLVKKYPDIEKDQYTVKGYGESMPIASNDTAEGRAKNRRVEFKVMNKDALERELERRKK